MNNRIIVLEKQRDELFIKFKKLIKEKEDKKLDYISLLEYEKQVEDIKESMIQLNLKIAEEYKKLWNTK